MPYAQPSVGTSLTVRKIKPGIVSETFSYQATVVEVADQRIVVTAAFGLDRWEKDGVEIVRGDVFTEHYYSERWFNILHIASPEGRPRGWYCNVAMPAEWNDEGISFVDLYLDLFVHPDGRYAVLDEDELAAANLLDDIVARAYGALKELIQLAESGALPVG